MRRERYDGRLVNNQKLGKSYEETTFISYIFLEGQAYHSLSLVKFVLTINIKYMYYYKKNKVKMMRNELKIFS